MKALPYSQDAYRLLHEGAIALAEVEANGIRIDMEYLNRTIRTTTKKIKHLEGGLQDSDVMKTWKKTFRGKTNVDSTDQLGKILFDVLKLPGADYTENNKYKTDEKTLTGVDHPFVKDFLNVKKLKKTLSTYLLGIHREVQDGYLHPFFNLHTTLTYRSSSDSPNFQNIPIRQPEMAKLIRRAFIARKGHRLVEKDFGGIEVGIAACYHKDPNMISYIEDKSKDMHRDMAMECFMLPLDELTPNKDDKEDVKRAKMIRYCGKNMFVFPQFYGSWYIDCARDLWNAIITHNLRKRDGTSLRQHLKENGITELGDLDPREKPRKGTFERHIRKVETAFWGERFPVYAQWKKDWYTSYQAKGWFLTKTGFICQGYMKKNEVINYAVQGSAFHCLLQALIWMVQTEIKKAGMKALVVGQIHDSIVSDVPDEEVDDYLALAQDIMTNRLKEAWEWICVPLEIEAEVTPIEGNWFEKKERKIGA